MDYNEKGSLCPARIYTSYPRPRPHPNLQPHTPTHGKKKKKIPVERQFLKKLLFSIAR